MKIFKNVAVTMIVGVVFFASISVSQSASFTGTYGEMTMSGAVFIDNDAANDGTHSSAAGIGTITQVHNANGDLVWDDSDHELNFGFDGFIRSGLAVGFGDTTFFTSTGGNVSFYENLLGTLQITGDWMHDIGVISDDGLNGSVLDLVGFEDVHGSAATGLFSNTSYSSNGQLEVVGGSLADIFDTNTIYMGSAGFADMTFNITGDTLATGGYDYSGAGSLAAVTVPEPLPLALLGFGLLGMGFVTKRRAR